MYIRRDKGNTFSLEWRGRPVPVKRDGFTTEMESGRPETRGRQDSWVLRWY